LDNALGLLDNHLRFPLHSVELMANEVGAAHRLGISEAKKADFQCSTTNLRLRFYRLLS